MSFSKGTNINENEWRWNAQSNLTLGNFGGQPTNPFDELVHWVVTVDDTGGADNKTKVTVYKNGAEVSTGDTDNNLSGLPSHLMDHNLFDFKGLNVEVDDSLGLPDIRVVNL